MEAYWRLPVRLQEAALSLYARRLDKLYYGSLYEEWKEWLSGWKDWPESYIKDWQNARLKHVIATAGRKVPYYVEKWKGRDWESVGSEAALAVLPTFEKQSIRQNEVAFIADDKNPTSLWLKKTSGTTGTSLRIYWPPSMLPKWWAITEVMIRHAGRAAREMPRAMMGGRPIISGNTSRPPYWRFNRRWNQLYLSSYHVSKKTASHYISALKKHGSQWLTGYGSAIAALAESASDAGSERHPLKTVIVSGDTLLPGMRRSIETFFQCKCFDSYGQAEGVSIAMECDSGRMHVLPVVGITEILRKDGSPCKPGEVGEIVATGLLNDAMPLIRYRTGDYASWAVEQDCPCGSPNRIIANLEGRVDDYLLTTDGRKIGRLSTALKRSPSIHSAQLVQDRPGRAYFLVQPGRGYKPSHATAVCDDILERIGRFDLQVVEVPEIPRTPRGKAALVVRLDDCASMKDVYEAVIQNSANRYGLPEYSG